MRKKTTSPSPREKEKKATARPAMSRKTSELLFKKFEGNPIIEPNAEHAWESKATFNPAALTAGGKVHLLYRALGDEDVSMLGYAVSGDGLSVEEQLAEPAYVPTEAFEGRRNAPVGDRPPLSYFSGGGGSGGCEDPRIVNIGDRVYMTFVAFNGWGSVRMALTSISLEDFLAKHWNWKKPILISPPGEIHKNWVIFPEKIKGKFAILHSISPRILIDYFDDLDELAGEAYIQSRYDRSERKGVWDNWIRGAGPPPIKTEYGWLLLYHAMDHRAPHLYKLGAMILDADDPTKILYRSSKPLLEPQELYETHGLKAGVVYACGAAVVARKLLVYYGGADRVTCVAEADLKEFLEELRHDRTPRLKLAHARNPHTRHRVTFRKSPLPHPEGKSDG